MIAPNNIVLLSSLPRFLSRFGLRHHFPLDPVPGTERTMSVRSDAGKSAADISFSELRPGSGGGEYELVKNPESGDLIGSREGALVHVTGVSGNLTEIVRGFHDRRSPIVYSPFLPELPGRVPDGLYRLFHPSYRQEMTVLHEIAAMARVVVAHDDAAREFLLSVAGLPAGKVSSVPSSAFPSGGATGPGDTITTNTIVAYCAALSPEWNVMRLLFAMEKLNCDARIVAAQNDSEYGRECLGVAARNPKITVVTPEPDEGGDPTDEIRCAAVVVDPSLRGLGFPLISAAGVAGKETVISERSGMERGPAGSTSFFEPTSWELLHHAITSALNRASDRTTGLGTGDGNVTAEAVRSELAVLYGEIFRGRATNTAAPA